MNEMNYKPQKIEKKWQDRWEGAQIFKVEMDQNKPKYYVLEMYPYPSSKLHMGHLRNYSIGDSFARFKRMQGYNVLYPMGYDSFGLPAENAAIDHDINPEKWTNDNIQAIKQQQQKIGLSYDWERMVYSHDPNYYKWDQWFFLKMFEKGLAYRQESYVNWCEKCITVLANEQVQGGKCWRCGSEVEQKFLTQWFLKIRAYADELLEGLEEVEWAEKVKIMQRNWIGRSEGTIIKFPIVGEERTIDIFTTRADTVYGVTFMVFAPEHPWIQEWVDGTDYENDYKRFYKETLTQNKFERTDADVEKKGMFIGKYAINPLTKEEIPIYIGNFVVYEYGAGAVMAVPAHDQRDFEFAKEYNIPIKVVIQPFDYELNSEKMTRAYVSNGRLVNSGEFDGMENRIAINAISDKLNEVQMGHATVNYKLRDWLISRQRYWGCPIPIIYCDECGISPVPYEDLPIELPKDVKFTGKGNPLETSETFKNVNCPKCNKMAVRETDTMDTFVDSSWYFFAFCDPPSQDNDIPYKKDRVDYWGNVDQYIGGVEHAVLHLLYARFWTKVSRDLGLHSHNEPFQKLLTQGMINKQHPYCPQCDTFALKSEMNNEICKRCGTKYQMKSAKMSKSLGNTVDPNRIMDEFGADSARFFILFGSSPESGLEWSEEGIGFASKFIRNLYSLLLDQPKKIRKNKTIRDTLILYFMNKTIKEVTEHFENLAIRDAVNSLIQFSNELSKYKDYGVNMDVFKICQEKFTLLLHPIAPHISEEIWEKNGMNSFVSLSPWPIYDDQILSKQNNYKWNLLHNTIEDINNIYQLFKQETLNSIELIIADNWKYSFYTELMNQIVETRDQGLIMKNIMQSEKFQKHGKFINQTVNNILKNIGKYTTYILDYDEEFKFFKQLTPILSEKFNSKVSVVNESDSQDQKAKQALPGRPAILMK